MTSDWRRSASRLLNVIALAAAIASPACKDDFVPGSDAAPPDSVTANALGLHLVQVRWKASAQATGYWIQRRADFSGEFRTVKELTDGTTTGWTDDSLSAETVYGYRVVALSANGRASTPSLIVGVMTPPNPGIEATTSATQSGFNDADGYTVLVTNGGRDTLRRPMLPNDKLRFSPLDPGPYVVRLDGIASNCRALDGVLKNATVTNQGVQTIASVSFNVGCRNPNMGHLAVSGNTSGDTTDVDGYTVTFSGDADNSPAVPAESLHVLKRFDVKPDFSLNFDNIYAGNYTLELDSLTVASYCKVQGAAKQTFRVEKLTDVTKSFTVLCQQPDDPTKPLIYQATWVPATAPQGQAVRLDVGMDISRLPGTDVKSFQESFTYDHSVIRYDSAKGEGRWTNLNSNGTKPDTVSWLNFVNGLGETSPQFVMGHFYFTVTGSAGATTSTSARFESVANRAGKALDTLINKRQATLTVTSGGGGGGGNRAPVARPGGPYTGTAGSAVSLNGSTSSDPDGSISGYNWTFGDGGTGTGASPSHVYGAAGTYTVTLTVTDNQGATNSASTTASISASGGGGGNQPPVARPGGPYSGTAGLGIAFSGTASSDPEGSPLTYSWNYGDGSAPGTGAQPVHVYSAAGTYVVQLTVTDDQNLTNSASTNVTVVPAGGGGGSTPFVLAGTFGARGMDDVVPLTITLDITQDIAETAGPEALKSWGIDSLKWDPAVLQYYAFNAGPGWVPSVNTTDALSKGKLVFAAVASSAQTTAQASGVVTLATVRFKVIGADGTGTTTVTSPGLLLSKTNSYSYNSQTSVVEATYTAGP